MRKVRSKAERMVDPYEWEIHRAIVTGLVRLLPLDYIVQANVQEREGGSAGSWAHSQGQRAGWPDIGVYGDGRCWLLEVKDRTGGLTNAQKAMHPRIRAAGIPLLPICRSLGTAASWLQDNGCRFRVRIAA